MTAADSQGCPSREQLIHRLYEAAELEHCLMCTYLYAAFSLRSGTEEGLTATEAAAVERWRRALLRVAIEEMGHLTAVWNITSALGGVPRFGRANFPLDPGILPAGMVVKLAPFCEGVLQHFIHLERPESSTESEGEGFVSGLSFRRGVDAPRLTPMALDYDTVGTFYAVLDSGLRAFVAELGEAAAFCGDPALQLGPSEVDLVGARPVICLKTARAAFTAIVEQGEGAPQHSQESHFQRFTDVRAELARLKAANLDFSPAWPAAENPVLRPPVAGRTDRVFIAEEEAARAVDLANTGYALMLRLIAYSYQVPRPQPEKALVVDLAIGLMRAVTLLGERAARLPAGSQHPGVNAGMSFTALRDAAPLPQGASARRFFSERLGELSRAAASFAQSGDARSMGAARLLEGLRQQAVSGFATFSSTTLSFSPPTASLAPHLSQGPGAATATIPAPAPTTVPAPAPSAALLAGSMSLAPSFSGAPPVPATPAPMASSAPTQLGAPLTTPAPAPSVAPPTPVVIDGVDHIEGRDLTLLYEGKKCIHSRFCVTWGPNVFLANVAGPWIQPDASEVDALVEIAHACPSGAIRYLRKDGKPNEAPPLVNLLAVREAGPYAVRADLRLNGSSGNYRATLCRCGASKNKPFCDGSHHEVGFSASGEPATGKADMLPVRDGPLSIQPQVDGPLQVRGNLEITSGTGRVVTRLVQARLCRCGGSSNKPFCDGTHARIGFRST